MEIEGYKGQIQSLKMESQKLLEKHHFASDAIREKEVYTMNTVLFLCKAKFTEEVHPCICLPPPHSQESIESQFRDLEDLAAKRHHRLVECKQLHHFYR